MRELGAAGRSLLRSPGSTALRAEHEHELETMISDKLGAAPSIPAAQLVLMGLLQAYESVSEEDAIEQAITNDRWKLVLGTLGSNESPCSKKTLVFFHQRMIEHNMSEKVLAKTIALAKETKLFDPRKLGKLRVVFDSVPSRGARRVEDAIDLVGHGIKTVVL